MIIIQQLILILSNKVAITWAFLLISRYQSDIKQMRWMNRMCDVAEVKKANCRWIMSVIEICEDECYWEKYINANWNEGIFRNNRFLWACWYRHRLSLFHLSSNLISSFDIFLTIAVIIVLFLIECSEKWVALKSTR